MECSMNIDSCNSDVEYEVLFDKKIKAVRDRTCHECGLIIRRGEFYEFFTGKDPDENIDKYRTCLDCLSVRNAFFISFCCGELWEDLEYEISELSGEVPESCLRDLTPRARELVCEIIEDTWDELDDDED